MKMMEPLGFGLHNIDADLYHQDPCHEPSLSASIAWELIGRSPLHAWTKHPRLNQDFLSEEKDAFDLGTAAHHMVLRQDFWREQIAVVDAEDWRTKAAREAKDEARTNGLVPILKRNYARLETMVLALEGHLHAGRAFKAGAAERTLIWQDEETSAWLRCRPDWTPDKRAAPWPDYKTTTDARPENWDRRFCLDHGGILRAAFYEEGIRRVCGVAEPTLCYVVQEVQPPYAVAVRVVEYDSAIMRLGRAMLRKAITRWAECVRTDTWPAYEPLIGTLTIPAWAEKTMTENLSDWLGATAPSEMLTEIVP